MNLDEIYANIKQKLSDEGFQLNPFRDIQYGIQFILFKNNDSALIRIYKSKKGIRLDLSQVSDNKFKQLLATKINPLISNLLAPKKDTSSKKTLEKEIPQNLIGVDESGKGDYFGPLVVSAVYVGQKERVLLEKLAVQDSKNLDDQKIAILAKHIKKHCNYSSIIMGNMSYNTLYHKMQNLNHMLSWAHAKAIEDVVKQVPAKAALSDKFASNSLIGAALKNNGISIDLFEQTKAERHLAVAAASIIARDSFVEQIEKISKTFQRTIPKGCSNQTLKVAKEIYEEYGLQELGCIAKLHFKLTQTITGQSPKSKGNPNLN